MVYDYLETRFNLVACLTVHLSLDLSNEPFSAIIQLSQHQQVRVFGIGVNERNTSITIYREHEAAYRKRTLLMHNSSLVLTGLCRSVISHTSACGMCLT